MILERHLVVADKAFTMADLRSMSNDTIVLPTIRDALTIRVREDGKRESTIIRARTYVFLRIIHTSFFFIPGYTIQWNQRNIPVFRSDVECTNGIIHVIDHPFLVDEDIRVTGGTQPIHRAQNIFYVFMVNVLLFTSARQLFI